MNEQKSVQDNPNGPSQKGPTPLPVLGIPGFSYGDLFSAHGLRRLYDVWLAELQLNDPTLSQRYLDYRDGAALGPVDLSDLLVEVTPHVSRFVTRLFRVGAAADA